MAPDRAGRLRLIGITAVVTFLLTIAGVYALAWTARQPPATPQFPAPKTITISLCPMPGWDREGSPPTEVPPDQFDRALRFITPNSYYGRDIHEWITPLSAIVVMTHDGRDDTCLLIRSGGHNPAMVSADGRHYYYAHSYPGTGDGAMQLRAFVREVGKPKPR